MRSAILVCLYASGRVMTADEIARVCNLSSDDVREELDKGLGDPWVVIRVSSGYRLATDPHYAPIIHALGKEGEHATLSRAALETLSLIAYRGPITKKDLEEIRGVNCSLSLRSLTMKDLISCEGDDMNPIISISEKTLRHCGISQREQLPDFHRYGCHISFEEIFQYDREYDKQN